MSLHSDDDDDRSPDEDEEEEEEEMFDREQDNFFLTDDPNLHIGSQGAFVTTDDADPIEARPPNEIDPDEQERHQSGTPAFRTLDDVRPVNNRSDKPFLSFSVSVVQRRSSVRNSNGHVKIEIHRITKRVDTVRRRALFVCQSAKKRVRHSE